MGRAAWLTVARFSTSLTWAVLIPVMLIASSGALVGPAGERKARKATKSRVQWWPWFRAVRDAIHADEAPRRPAPASIEAVATNRYSYADADGTRSYPSRQTLALNAGLKPRTVTLIDEWLISKSLMRFVRKHPTNVSEFALTLPPVPPPEVKPTAGADVPAGDKLKDDPRGPVRPLVRPPGANNLLPKVEEEEIPTAAPGGAPPVQMSESQRARAQLALEAITEATDGAYGLDPDVIAPFLAELVAARPEWDDPEIIAHVVAVRLKRAKSNPTAFLAGALRQWTAGEKVQLPAWAQVVSTWLRIVELRTAIDERAPLFLYRSDRDTRSDRLDTAIEEQLNARDLEWDEGDDPARSPALRALPSSALRQLLDIAETVEAELSAWVEQLDALPAASPEGSQLAPGVVDELREAMSRMPAHHVATLARWLDEGEEVRRGWRPTGDGNETERRLHLTQLACQLVGATDADEPAARARLATATGLDVGAGLLTTGAVIGTLTDVQRDALAEPAPLI